jgi:hypothetical protein
MSPRSQKVLTALATVAMLLVLVWAQGQGYLGTTEPGGAGGTGGSATVPPAWPGPAAPAPARREPPAREPAPAERSPRYAPQGPAPAQALPGGSLQAHEGRPGHTLERHVGRTPEQLRARMHAEQKREVSSFTDLATAERAVARALFEKRRDVNAWLEDGAQGDTSITWRGQDTVGAVLREDARSPVPGRTVHVVLVPSRRFPEGFAILTAYVRLP